MKRDSYWQKPKKAQCGMADAWWYANKGHVEVHVQHGSLHLTIKLPRRQMAEYVKRSYGDKHEG